MRFTEQRAKALRERYSYLIDQDFSLRGKNYSVKDINLFPIMTMYGNDYYVRVLLEPTDEPGSNCYELLDNFLEKAGIEFEPSDFH